LLIMPLRRVLVTGAQGLLGAAIAREFERTAEVVARGHSDLDVADEDAVLAAFDDLRPDAVINCAAYNNVDAAEDNPVEALNVNAFGVLSLSRAAAAHSARLVHYSSDFVFDGTESRPYTEEDLPNPRGVYAASKLLGEWFALETLARGAAWVLRVESLFGDPGPSSSRSGSLGTIVRRIREGEEVPVFIDRTVSPSFTADVARATRAVLESGAPPGLYHCVNSGAATWADIAQEIAALLGRPLRMKEITLESAALKAPRPRYCALSNARLAAAGVPMPTWKDALARYLAL
jgi:dTDP-4-dehydrorhamnose reductase